jgi:hypothetical protein
MPSRNTLPEAGSIAANLSDELPQLITRITEFCMRTTSSVRWG